MKITPDLFEAYLKCPTKCFLRAHGEKPTGNEFADWMQTQTAEYASQGIQRLRQGCKAEECVCGDQATVNVKIPKWHMATSFPVSTENLQSTIHAVEHLPSHARGGPARFIPVRFIARNKVTRDDKLLLAFDARVLAESIGRASHFGKIIHGDDYVVCKVKTAALKRAVDNTTGNISELITRQSPPELVLNRHCSECEFQSRCRGKAIEKDELSLLANLHRTERKQLKDKGIFTVTQLSYTFRPRRRPKHLKEKREKYHHSLKALAIRERKIHVVGSPRLNITGTPVLLDVESIPDWDFYYLIGIRILKNGSSIQHSFWADTRQDERRIWEQFIQVLVQVENPVLVHYGSFEETFIRHMRERYPQAGIYLPSLEQLSQQSINVLAFIYGQVYFPTYSNGLKEIAGFLGFNWPDQNATGAYSVVLRHRWEGSMATDIEQRIRTYNAADCEALELLVKTLWRLPGPEESRKLSQEGAIAFVRADLADPFSHPSWRKFQGATAELNKINAAAQWDYQRDRIYLRDKKQSGRRNAPKRKTRGTAMQRAELRISLPERPICPKCHRKSRKIAANVSHLLQDLVFGRSSIKRRTVRYDLQEFWCQRCRRKFGSDERFYGTTKFGWNLVALYFYLTIDLGIYQQTVARMCARLFDVHISLGGSAYLRSRIAGYYSQAVNRIMEKIAAGHLVQVDETKARKGAGSGYVWVFTNAHEVVYLHSESREADTLRKALSGFNGVLVSDFYAAYDSVECQQQKCLIHLMRDLNNGVLAHPYDEELKQLVQSFGSLLKAIIETIDCHGLKKRFMNKHVKSVRRFYRELSRRAYCSEAAIQCKRRFEKNHDGLFRFLRHDGVPWNNNNAEHAIKAYARARRLFTGIPTTKTISEFLVLLSVCETCRNKGIDFLDFLRSGETDIEVYVERGRNKRQMLS